MAKIFFERNSVNFIYECDTYFAVMDSIRYNGINVLNKNTIQSLLDCLNGIDIKIREKDFFNKRAVFYFILADYRNALIDLDTSQSIDSNLTTNLLCIKALTLEALKEYDNAIGIYKDLAKRTTNNTYNIFAAIANRKKNSGQIKLSHSNIE